MFKPIMFVVVLCCSLVAPGTASAQEIEPSFRADVEKLLAVTGSNKLALQMATAISSQLIDAMKKQHPEIPGRAAEIVRETITNEFSNWALAPDGLQAKTVDIYARHFTHDEILQLLAFYQSDIGKKAVSELPALMQEGIVVGQEWSQANMPRIVGVVEEKLKAEGLIK